MVSSLFNDVATCPICGSTSPGTLPLRNTNFDNVVKGPGPAPVCDAQAALSGKIKDRTARVGIIGLGYVGLPLAKAFATNGFPVLGFDIDPAKVDRLQRGESYIEHIPADMVARHACQGLRGHRITSAGSTKPTPSSSACRRR